MTLRIEQPQPDEIHIAGVLNRETLMLYSPFTLLNKLTGTVRFDLAGLTGIDTAGLAWLIQQLALAKQKSLRIELHNVPPQLLSLAEVSAVTALLPIID